jgi:quinoprotein glucose dehydrogenase
MASASPLTTDGFIAASPTWRNGDDERVVILTAFAHMIALDAKTGKPVPGFGRDGWVDLAPGPEAPVDREYYTMSSPPVIVRDVIVVGSSVMDWWRRRPSPPGDVRGFDVRSGRSGLDLHTVPQAGEPGSRPGSRTPGRKPATPTSGRR